MIQKEMLMITHDRHYCTYHPEHFADSYTSKFPSYHQFMPDTSTQGYSGQVGRDQGINKRFIMTKGCVFMDGK